MLRAFFQVFSFLSVALGQPAFVPWLGPIAAGLGIALHWKSLDGMSLSKVGKASFLWFFLVQMVQTSWMVNLEYQGIYILALYFLISVGLAWQFSFLTKIAYKKSRFDLFSMLYIAGIWFFLEWSRLHILCGFSFNFLGVSLSCYPVSLQMASLFGVLGMSFWVVITNLAAWHFFRKFSWSSGIRWGFLVVAPYLYGSFHLIYQDYLYLKSGRGVLSVLLVQPSLSPSQKYCLKGRESDFFLPLKQWDFILQSISVYKNAALDLVALPEAVVPFGLDLYIYNLEEANLLLSRLLGKEASQFFPAHKEPFVSGKRSSNAYFLQTLSNFFKAPVLAGLDFQRSNGELYNSAFYFEPESLIPKRYDKRVLLPLAEYMPFSFLTRLSQYYGIEEFFTPGKLSQVFPSPLLISPSICYEELFPSLMREGRKNGAQLFVSLSNDGWYPSSNLPLQHFTHGLIRSVENGVPLIRACNTGVTAAVDGLGRVVGKLQAKDGDVEHISGCLFVQVPQNQHVTCFALWGELPLIGLCLFFIFYNWVSMFFRNGFSSVFFKRSA